MTISDILKLSHKPTEVTDSVITAILKGVVTLFPKIERGFGRRTATNCDVVLDSVKKRRVLRGNKAAILRGQMAFVDSVKGFVIDPEKAGYMYTDAKWHKKSSSYRLSCSYVDENENELYAEVVKKKGSDEIVTPYRERKEKDAMYGVNINGIYEAESGAMLAGVISYLKRIHNCAEPRPLIIVADNEGAVADFNLCSNGWIGADFFQGRSSKLSHVQAKYLCEFFRVPVTAVLVDRKMNISDMLSKLNLRGQVPRLEFDTFELLALRDAGGKHETRTFGDRTRVSFEAYSTLQGNLGMDLAIRMRKAEEITMEEIAFHENLTNGWEQLALKHISVEGPPEFKAILFVPKRAPSDLYDIKNKPTNIKFYFRGMFLMDNCVDLVPDYLSFVGGTVDCEHWPFEEKKMLEAIRKILVKKCFELFIEIAENKEDYDRFKQAYSKKLKLGFIRDVENRGSLAQLLMFRSTKSGEEMTSLKDYVRRMKEGQRYIFFHINRGYIKEVAEDSPRLEWLMSYGFEVLHLVGPLDGCIVRVLHEFEGKHLVRAI